MKRRFPLILAFCAALCVVSCRQQDAPAAGEGNAPEDTLLLSSGLYHPYAPLSLEDTPAPKGYRAFYLSHYGRHGSRYVEYPSTVTIALNALRDGDLTPKGEALRDSLEALYRDSDGLWGMLTPRGAEEHRAIGARMAARFPEIFSSRDRRRVHCLASMLHRCILSMVSSTDGLQSGSEGLVLDYTVGERYMPYIMNKNSYPKGMRADNQVVINEWRARHLDYDAILSRWFKDPSVVEKPQDFMFSLYQAWAQQTCTGQAFLPIYDFITPRELYVMYQSICGVVWSNHGWTEAWGMRRLPVDLPLLNHVIEHADAALADGTTAADLRYGHDIGLLPLVCLMRLEGFDRMQGVAERAEHWDGAHEMCMASNVQLVFFAPKADLDGGKPLDAQRVLVKALYNERETAIPALESVEGPYYRWSDVRAYWRTFPWD